MKKSRSFRLFNATLVVVLATVSSSCMSIMARRNPRINSPAQPKVYPGLETIFNFSGETKSQGGFEFKFPWYANVIGGTVGVICLIIDVPLEIALDTLLLPTDLIFNPGAIIGKEITPEPSSRDPQHDPQEQARMTQ